MNQENAVKPWFIYLIATKSNKYYCGITTDLTRRFKEHCAQSKKTAKALRGQAPLRLEFSAKLADKSTALKTELWVKRLDRSKKHALINGSLELPIEHELVSGNYDVAE